MKGEIHFINLVRSSPRLRELVFKLLGSSPRPWERDHLEDLLLRLPLEETLVTLAERLECDRDQVFTKIVTRITPSIAGLYPLQFTFDYLRDLDTIHNQSHLASILNCEELDVVDELFDVHALLGTLFEFSPEMVRQILRSRIRKDRSMPSANKALYSILLVQRRIEEHFGIENSAWGKIIDEQNWLKHTALDKLVRFCSERGIVQPSGSSLLAAVLEESSDDQIDSSDVTRLDALAIIHIQQRINWIVQQLREQADDLAQSIAERLPTASFARLKQHLDFYELKAPASAWRNTIAKEAGSSAIREKFPKVEIRSTGNAGTPLKSSVLTTRTEHIYEKLPFWKFRRKRKVIETNLIVSCQTEEADGPIDILICRNVSPDQFALLEEFFSAIPAITAPQKWVADIGKKLLHAPRIFSQSFADILVTACGTFSRELIRALILAGVRLESGLESKLLKQLGSELWIKPVEANRDVVHPLNRAAIIELIRGSHGDQANIIR